MQVPALIDSQQWHAAQHAMQSRRRGQGRPGSRLETFPLTGRFKCLTCGYAMSGHAPKPGLVYYVCSRSRQDRADPASRCNHRTHYRTVEIHAIVLAELNRLAIDANSLTNALPEPPAPRDQTAERRRLETRLARARASYEAGIDTLEEYAQTKTDVKTRLAGLISLRPAPPRDPNRIRQRVLSALSQESLVSIVRDANAKLSITAAGEVTLELGL